MTAPSPPVVHALPRPGGDLVGEAEPDGPARQVSESPAGGAYPAAVEPLPESAIAHGMRDLLVEGARSLGTLILTLPDLWREKLDMGIRLALVMGATGGALVPILASPARLSNALESGGVAALMETVVAAGGCVLLSTVLGSILGLIGGLLGRNSGAADRLIPDAERRRTVYTVMGGACGAGLALVVSVVLSYWLIQPG